MRIQTPRITLRMPQLGDHFAVNEAVNESFEDLRPWMGWAQQRPDLQDSARQVGEAISRWELGLEYRMYMFHMDVFVGSSGYVRVDKTVPKFEIGYWCRSSHSGRGFVKEAVEALSNTAFGLGAARVEIKCDLDNSRSAGVAKSLGFTFDGILRKDSLKADGSGYRDTVIYSKVR